MEFKKIKKLRSFASLEDDKQRKNKFMPKDELDQKEETMKALPGQLQIDPKARMREAVAKRIMAIHQHQVPMEAGWRHHNDFNLQNFAYSIADIILDGTIDTKIDALNEMLPLPTPPTVHGSSDYNNGYYAGFNGCSQVIATKLLTKVIELKKEIKCPEPLNKI